MAQPYVAYSETQSRAIDRFRSLEGRMGDWLDQVVDAIADRDYRIVGCTSTFEQIVCSVALLNRIKKRRPGFITIIGGANCDGEMAEGISSIGVGVDYVFSGESDATFPEFVRCALAGRLPEERIISGRPWPDMDACPTPLFEEFFEQRKRYTPSSRRSNSKAFLTYETSRGCWWGQKQHCTFCGLNAEGMVSRRKSAERVVEELAFLTRAYPTRNIAMTDAIMPHEYFGTLLPKLSSALPGLTIFYEQKANLTLPQVLALKESGITAIQPGIESLSSSMLQRMKKGLQAWQNLLLLRYSRITGLRLWWSILCGFPGDRAEEYTENIRLATLIHHLPPPVTLWHLMIDRFSPYFTRPSDFGIRQIEPYPAYADFLPDTVDARKIAYHFVADYDSAADTNPEIVGELAAALLDWRKAWSLPYHKRPELKVELSDDVFLLLDTRGLSGTKRVREIDAEEAALLLIHQRYGKTAEEDRAVEQKLAVVVDGWFVPLPVARIDLMRDVLSRRPEGKLFSSQLDELGSRKDIRDMRRGLVSIACSGSLSCLEHPLTPP
jgi:ribosomal peptide maturation radical SAM protein 1